MTSNLKPHKNSYKFDDSLHCHFTRKIQNTEFREFMEKTVKFCLTFVVLTENKGVSKGDDEDFLDELLSCTWKTSAKASVQLTKISL